MMPFPSKFILKNILALMAGIFLFSGCKEDSKINDKVDFDRKAMLENYYDNIILLAFFDFNSKVNELKTQGSRFINDPTMANFEDFKSGFAASYKSFQKVKALEMGPSANSSFKANLNTYPTDTQQIEQNILSNLSDLSSAQQINAKGFPALDFLLFTKDLNFWTGTQANLRLDYLDVLLDDISQLTNQNFSEWESFRQHFINASGTDVGSSLGQLVNSINKDYELIKNAKIGFPAGKKTLGRTYPEASEGFYSKYLSIELAALNCEAIRFLYKGISYDGNTDGLGLEDYLMEIGTQSFGKPTYQLIDDQLREASIAIREIPSPFSESIEIEKDKVNRAYTAIQKTIISLKTEMPSALGILITYQDNDGD